LKEAMDDVDLHDVEHLSMPTTNTNNVNIDGNDYYISQVNAAIC
jgi:hypothetical protein